MSPTGSRVLTPAGGPLTQPIHQHDRWSPGKLGVGIVGGEAGPLGAAHTGIPRTLGLGPFCWCSSVVRSRLLVHLPDGLPSC